MADQKITITAKPSKIQQINVTSNRIANEIVATPDTSLYYSNLSKQWATKMDGLVVNEDYSSKYYAEKSKQSAETAKMEASTVNSLLPELQETFTIYNATLSETAGNAITEININRDYAITQVNTTSADAVSIVEQTLSKAVSDVNGLSNKAITEITQEAQKQIANIESTGFYIRDDKLYFIDSNGEEQEFKSGGDTLPLFHNFYSQEDMTSTGAYVNASLGSWLSGNVYETAYNELVNKIGTDNVKAVTDTYTDYDFVVNQDDITFRLPLLNGKEYLPSDDKISLNILPSNSTYTAPQNGWYSFVVISSVANGMVNLYCEETGLGQLMNANATQAMRGSVAVSKGDVVHYIYPNNSTNVFLFTPAKGDGNLYYKVANAVTNLELLNAGEVLNAVNLKADINLSNVNENGKSLMSEMAMPSNKFIDLTLGASGSIYTAPANGYVAIKGDNGIATYLGARGDGGSDVVANWSAQSANFIPVRKGQSFSVGYAGKVVFFRFTYAEGEV